MPLITVGWLGTAPDDTSWPSSMSAGSRAKPRARSRQPVGGDSNLDEEPEKRNERSKFLREPRSRPFRAQENSVSGAIVASTLVEARKPVFYFSSKFQIFDRWNDEERCHVLTNKSCYDSLLWL